MLRTHHSVGAAIGPFEEVNRLFIFLAEYIFFPEFVETLKMLQTSVQYLFPSLSLKMYFLFYLFIIYCHFVSNFGDNFFESYLTKKLFNKDHCLVSLEPSCTVSGWIY